MAHLGIGDFLQQGIGQTADTGLIIIWQNPAKGVWTIDPTNIAPITIARMGFI